ncbi:4,4-dimethyl-9beta19-cyclopropylsterol-4alpha-methyl oxidase protein [Dioscorea alata]|uniref:4, 4-dimethyl-9beta19-cyclopropylsterol-4alpha-methyl oxidase protein n=1 Tax=Dioscorea alata TaxID=55571 RepID=A0ACB7WVV0_DIOAL|nr:4,4-dimethyl-9beta19-cyclopropylsterol-4alpha-methyl oxidase protein [Dioscorea alata]
MLPFGSSAEAEAALGRSLTAGESFWFWYSAGMHDFWLYAHNIVFLLIVYTIAPLPVVILELRWPKLIGKYKLQPKVRNPPSAVIRCYKDVVKTFVLAVGPLQILSFPTIKGVGIRTGLPLPSWWEVVAQLVVYFLVEDYFNYWIHRMLHSKWGYQYIHHVHHEFTAPIGFAAPYAHWSEVLILGIPAFLGPAIVPGHIITFWLWMVIRHVEAIETHSGYDFPQTPTKYIPFYGGAEYHDYHHYVGGQSHSNFASVFTYCDYIYGTDKGYRYQKSQLAQLREEWKTAEEEVGIKNNGELEKDE